jgi:tRNA(fMet)-specific endonuclease VapC
MNYLIDTCIFVEILRGKLPHVLQKMLSMNPSNRICTSTIVHAELWYGFENGIQTPAREQQLFDLLAPFPCWDFDRSIVRTYGKIRAYLSQQGNQIGGNDMLIAATALEKNLTVVTDNLKEFQRVPGLLCEVWN